MKKNVKSTHQNPQFNRPVEKIFLELNQVFGSGNYLAYAIFMILFFFGLMGLIWMIPFPKLTILERMNAQTFLNWGSFFIAIVIYCYLRLAPTLSYAVLFSIGIMSYFIVQLEYVERDGGPTVVLVTSILMLIGLIGLWFSANKQNVTINQFTKLLTYGPVWLWSKVFTKLNWKF
ncbi:hypothetical protein ACFRAE_11765 [Sphingobacterium sp. HJSM2_6]|uniref:hypothetical protein n=1 Tax=Sphingobacterium sp. HJSM2_6 TaxID=3366264 RepID=UPI003BE2B08E